VLKALILQGRTLLETGSGFLRTLVGEEKADVQAKKRKRETQRPYAGFFALADAAILLD